MKKREIGFFDQLWLVTVLFFALGFVHIAFSFLGVICMTIPFMLFAKSGEKLWCKIYCPRASLFLRVLRGASLKRRLPRGFTKQGLKNGVLVYFGINLLFVMMSTIMVGLERVAPIDYLRFMIVFPVPFTMPQIIDLAVAPWALHLSYRIYSMMMTSTIIGLTLGFVFVPRAWCVICPIQTLTTVKKVPAIE